MSEIYMMVTICNRKQMQKFVKFYKQNHVDTGNISLAMGTAASDVLDYFGLEEDEKGIHFCLVTRPTWKTVKKGLQTELKIDVPGTGIVFLIPLSSIGGKHQLKFMLGEQEFEKGEETTLKETKHELIIAIANYGYNTQVMRAAEEGGATGERFSRERCRNETGRTVSRRIAGFRKRNYINCYENGTEKCDYEIHHGKSRNRDKSGNHCVFSSGYQHSRTSDYRGFRRM